MRLRLSGILAVLGCSVLLKAQLDRFGSFTLDSPLDYQVFQRRTRLSGRIRLSSHSSGGKCDAIRVRLFGKTISGSLLDSARVVSVASCTFETELEVPAGGWFTLEAEIQAGGETTAKAVVEHVGVGEVFVISGQSNSTNYGEAPQRTETGMVSTFGGSGWTLANDPQPGVQDHSGAGSFIPSFADALYGKVGVPVGVACVGYGGTSVRQWLPHGDRFESPPTARRFFVEAGPDVWESDGTLFDGMVNRIRQLGPHGFRALLWHQGESDANQAEGHNISSDDYRRMMKRLISATEKEAGWNFPWFVAQVTYHNPEDSASPSIREAQRSLWLDGTALQGPDTDTLTGDYRDHGGKGVHLSAKGLQVHGRMWADKVSAWLKPQLQ